MNLYISNLSYNVTDADLNELFADYGEILSARVITDRETGRSRGFGFVELKDDDLAKKAIEELNQATYDEKVINVTEARPREDVVETVAVVSVVIVVVVTAAVIVAVATVVAIAVAVATVTAAEEDINSHYSKWEKRPFEGRFFYTIFLTYRLFTGIVPSAEFSQNAIPKMLDIVIRSS